MQRCIERKRLLSGGEETYVCELLHYEPGFGILQYLIDRDYDVHGELLHPGDVTIALYWEDRPYTLYIWRRISGPTLFYFNLADDIALAPEEFCWRDLVVDILVDGSGIPHVLDEHELPVDLDQHVRSRIEAAQALVLGAFSAIISESLRILRNHGL